MMSQNIVLVTIDSLRADHCGFLGSDYDTTPELDALADESVVYEQAVAPGPRTPSSMPVVFTGEFYQPRSEPVYETWEEKQNRWEARRSRIRRHLHRHGTLTEELRARGYTTAAFTANPWTAPDTGFDRGFDEFRQVGASSDDEDEPVNFGGLSKFVLEKTGRTDWFVQWPHFYDRIEEAVTSLESPYFLWIFLMEPHQPYFAPRAHRTENTALEMYYSNYLYNARYGYTAELPPHLDARLKRSYRDAVRSADAFVGRITEDVAEDTAVVVHADHGEAFREHGAYGHRLQLYEENVRVPLLVHNAGVAADVAAPISLRSIPELVSSLSGRYPFDPTRFTTDFTVSRTEESEREAVRGAGWKYVRDAGAYSDIREGDELFDLSEDPTERRNLVETYSTVRDDLRNVLEVRGQSELGRVTRATDRLVGESDVLGLRRDVNPQP